MRFIDSGNMLTQRHSSEVPSGQYKELIVYMSGTNAGGATLALSNLNNLRVSRNGQDFVNIDFDLAANLSDLLKGMITAASAIGAAFEFCFHIPFYVGHEGDYPNILNVSEEDKLFVHLDFGNLAALVAAGEWKLYGIHESGEEKYLPLMVQDLVSFAGAGALEKRKAPINNLYSIYAFPSVAANFAKLIVEKDGKTVFDANYAEGQTKTNLDNRKEATAIEVCEARVALGYRLDELFSESLYVTPSSQTGAVNIELVYTGALFDRAALQASRVALDQQIARNIDVKRAAGKPDPDEALIGTGR